MRGVILFMLAALAAGTASAQLATQTRQGTVRLSPLLSLTVPGSALDATAGQQLKALVDANTSALAGKQNTITGASSLTTGNVTSSSLTAGMVYLTGANATETAGNTIRPLSGGGLELAGNTRLTTGGIGAGGNFDIKPDGNLYMQSNINGNRAVFMHNEGISINRGTNTARAPVDIGSNVYVEGGVTIAGSLTTGAASLTYNSTGKKVITGSTVEQVFSSVDQALLAARATGILNGGAVSINTDASRFNVGAGSGTILNLSDPANPVYTRVSWPASTSVLPAATAGNASYIYYDANGTLQQITAKPSNSQMRLLGVFVGKVQTNATGTIVATQMVTDPVQGAANLIGDLANGIGVFVQNGARISGTSGLSIAIGSGQLYDHGGFFQAQPTDPSTANIAAANPKGFRYLTQSGASVGNDIFALDPAKYDNAGTITTVPAGGLGVTRVTNQRVYLYPSGNVRIQYGQKFYESMGDATAGIGSEAFTVNPNQTGNSVLVAVLTMQVTATATNDITKVIITPASRFGEVGGGGSSAVTSTSANVSITGTNGVTAVTSGNAVTVSGVNASTGAVGVIKPGVSLTVASDGTANVASSLTLTSLSVTAASSLADMTVNGNVLIPTANNRYFGFDGLAAGQTVRFRMGDPTGGIDITSGQALVFKGYHGTVLQNQSGGTGPGVRINGLASDRNIAEFYDASSALRASMSQTGQLTVNGGIKFPDGTVQTTASSTATGGGTSTITFAASLSELAAATTRLVVYDGNTWIRSTGNVSTDNGANGGYSAISYNSGSDHYDRQFMGRAKFEWWRFSSSNTWEQMKYAANAGAANAAFDVQVANGDYNFNQFIYIPPGTHIFGNETAPDSVRFHIQGSTPILFQGWFWIDGTNGMNGVYRKKMENIVLAGFTMFQESTFSAVKDNNDFYGPISLDGGGSADNVIRNIKFKQVSSTAITNVVLIKMGTQKVCESLLIDNVQSLTSTVNGRMLVEVLNQGDGSNSPERVQVPARNVEIRNCIADGFRFGISIAGNFLKPYVHHNIVRNCTDYGIEFAGPLVDGRCEYNGFGGTQNVLIAANYVAGTAADWVFPTGSGQRYVGNFTEGKVTGGYIEIRSGGVIDFSDNNFQIDGGIYLQQTTVAGVRGGQFTRNRIVSTLTNTNWRNVTTNLIYLNGASNVHLSANYLERGGTDASAVIQSNDNGVSSVVNYYYGNVIRTGTNGTYFGNANTTGVRFNNFDQTGTARN